MPTRVIQPRHRVLAAILLFIGFYKVLYASHQTYTDVDGGFYTNIATHIRDGDGFVTDVSILHKGMPYFPHPSTFYPLWLHLYGYLGRLLPVPIVKVGFWAPTVFYFVALVAGYAWARRSFGGEMLPQLGRYFDSGHMFVLMLGLDWTFFVFTSMPHTEGLAYALLLLAMLRLQQRWPRANWATGLEVGVWCGLVVLTRTQLLLLPLAVWATVGVAIVCHRERVRYLYMGVASVGSFLVMMTPYYIYMKGIVYDFHWWHVIRVDQARVSDILSKIVVLKQTPNLWSYIADRAYGFVVAFRWGSVRSYWRHFYVWHYAVPVAVVVVGATLWKNRREPGLWARVRIWLADGRNLNTIFVMIFAVAGFLSIHTMHKDGHGEWNFQRRHGLTSLFLVFLCLRFLIQRQQRAIKALGLAIFISGTVMGIAKVRHTALRTAAATPRRFRPELVDWINGQKSAFDRLIIAERKPQLLARFTPGVGYHWYFERTYLEDIRAMVEEFGVVYVIVNPREKYEKYPFLEDPRFQEWFEKVTSRSGFDIYRPTGELRSEPWRKRHAELAARRRSSSRRQGRNKVRGRATHESVPK